MRKKLLLILSLLAFVFIFSACNAGITDKMSIDKDFRGERTINISIEKSILSNIKGGIPALSKLLKEEVKDPLTIDVITETDNLLEVNIKMKFDSLQDYKKKVALLYKKGNIEEEANIEYIASSKSFEDDIYFTENVTGKNLVKHLIDISIDKGLIAANKSDDIWSNYGYSFNFKNRELLSSSQPPFLVKEKKYLGPSLYLVTSSKSVSPSGDKDLWNRNFNLIFSKEADKFLDKNWAEKLVEDPDTLATKTRSSIKYNGEDCILYQFQVKDRPIEEISSISEQIIQSSNNLDLSIKENTSNLSIDYHFYEKYKSLDDIQGTAYDFIYYKSPLESSKHFPGNSSDLDNRKDLIDIVETDREGLENAFDYRHSENASFDQADTSLYIYKNQALKRTFSIKKNKKSNKKVFNSLLMKFLDERKISYDNFADRIEFSYGPDKFQEVNKIFFTKGPDIKQEFNSLFTDKVTYVDKASLKGIQVREINQDVKLGSGLKLIKSDLNASNSQVNNLIIVNENNFIPRVFYYILPLAILALILVWLRKNKGKKTPFAKDFM